MSELYVTLGLPRSGKSTLADRWSKYEISLCKYSGDTKFFNQEGNFIPKRVVVSPDSIRLALGHRFNWHVESFVHATAQVMVKTLLYQDYDVLVDCTNSTQESLIKWMYIKKDIVPVIVNTNVGECINRANKTGQSDLIPVIERMYNQSIENFGRDYCNIYEVLEKLKKKVDSNVSVGAIV